MAESLLIPWGYTTRAKFLKHAWERYRLTEDRWTAFWEEQEGKCGGCRQPLAHPWIREVRFGLKPETDHCHSQPKELSQYEINLKYVRGIL